MRHTASKKKRILLHVILILLILILTDFFSGLPSPIAQIQFRREERAKLIGPSRILGMEDIDISWCDTMIVAETESGAILWISGRDLDRSDLAYRRKGNGSVLVAPPCSFGFYGSTEELQLPLILFDKEPKARTAQLRFTLSTYFNEEYFEREYTLLAEREAQGYFRFDLIAEQSGVDWLGAEGCAIQTFINISSEQEQNISYTVPIHVRFYDGEGKLIKEETIMVTGIPGD